MADCRQVWNPNLPAMQISKSQLILISEVAQVVLLQRRTGSSKAKRWPKQTG